MPTAIGTFPVRAAAPAARVGVSLLWRDSATGHLFVRHPGGAPVDLEAASSVHGATHLPGAADPIGVPHGALFVELVPGNGGTFNTGAWRTRNLQTTLYNTGGVVSALTANQFTIEAGTYDVEWAAVAYRVNQHQSAFANLTDGMLYLGTTVYCTNTYAAVESSGSTRITFTAPKLCELQHRCVTTRVTNGFGNSAGWGNNMYSRIKITRVG